MATGAVPSSDALFWPPLREGDRVRLVSPASWPEGDGLRLTKETLEGWGLTVDVGAHATDRYGYMAGRDADRLADLNDAFRDPTVRAIVATRGGAGAYRISDQLDFAAARRDPKPVLGFSDITDLHLALWRECRLVCFHGCVIGSDAARSARALLMGTNRNTVVSDPSALSAGVRVSGVASGPLVGGNFSTIAHRVGAGLPDLRGAILLIEDTRGIGIGRVDRQLTQLRRAGALAGLAGVALGLISGFDDYVDRGWTVLDVLRDHLCELGVPVHGGLPIGHGGALDADGFPDQVCVALGADAVLDADAGTLTMGGNPRV
ncbi:S66 peptidase family protein [Pseudonocardia sp. TRM90224]|uniref:S66 peptidase family protein n=1 Tax=Pseudonocardia sp. TRM90224 TaxID=2812678 RepID=UPI001E2F337D|nr:LD-carboxypeptidase [Pseudonocardia sp. TRM90224]